MPPPEPNTQPDVEPTSPSPPMEAQNTKPSVYQKSFAKINRELSDNELSNPVVHKLLLVEMERLESEYAKGKEYENKYHIADKDVAVLREKFKVNKTLEVIHIACTTLGGIALGASSAANWLLGLLGLALIIAGIIAKIIRL